MGSLESLTRNQAGDVQGTIPGSWATNNNKGKHY